ncbi:hypothetical protein [Staphylococcus cohnii]|uniref:hypothetical protein n=1 Tax=Staphylococcus cohnii TaxID=29382 RepID=UPI001F42B3DB|nr:hypothetical protein [Staphylococcus cohnii]
MRRIDHTYVLDTNKLGDFMKMFHSNGWIGHNKDKIKAVMNANTHIVIAKYNGSVVESVRYLSGGVFNASIYDSVRRMIIQLGRCRVYI